MEKTDTNSYIGTKKEDPVHGRAKVMVRKVLGYKKMLVLPQMNLEIQHDSN